MPIGDDALAAGMTLVNGAAAGSAAQIDDYINETRDEIARRAPNPTPVNRGGTGASTASAARSNLGVPNFPITSASVVTYTDPNLGAAADGIPRYNTTGKLATNDPTAPLHAANRQWVEAQVAAIPSSDKADGPTSAAYNRNATGSGFFAVWMNSALQFMRNTSSRKYKKNIRDWSGSALALRTVIFDRRGKDARTDEVGFIAEEVLKTLPEAVVYFNGKVDGIDDRVILAALVSDVQRLAAEVRELRGE